MDLKRRFAKCPIQMIMSVTQTATKVIKVRILITTLITIFLMMKQVTRMKKAMTILSHMIVVSKIT